MVLNDIGKYANEIKVAAVAAELQARVTVLEDSGPVELQTDVTTLQTEVETASTGLLDRATALEGDVGDIQSDAGMVAGPVALTNDALLTKQISRKVLTVGAGPNNETVTFAHGVTPVLVTRCDIILADGSGNRLCFGQGGMLGADVAHSIQVAIDGTNVSLTSGSGGDFSGYAGSIIFEYTLA